MESFININRRVYWRVLAIGLFSALIAVFLKYGNAPEFFNRSFAVFFFTVAALTIVSGFLFMIAKPGKILSEEAETDSGCALYILRSRNAFILCLIFWITAVLTYSTSTDMSYFFLLIGCLALTTALILHGVALILYKRGA